MYLIVPWLLYDDIICPFRYKGTYCSQEVAIKVLKPDLLHKDMLTEFAQEVFIMRSVRYTFICVVCTMHWLVPTQSTNYFFWFLVFIPWYS